MLEDTKRSRAGTRTTQGGWSHSWVRPTSRSPRPSAATISVTLGSRETIRTARHTSARGFRVPGSITLAVPT